MALSGFPLVPHGTIMQMKAYHSHGLMELKWWPIGIRPQTVVVGEQKQNTPMAMLFLILKAWLQRRITCAPFSEGTVCGLCKNSSYKYGQKSLSTCRTIPTYWNFNLWNRTQPIYPGGCAGKKSWICQSTCTIEVTCSPSSMEVRRFKVTQN